MRNMDRMLNKKRPIEHTVEVNIYYQRHRERIEINVFCKQKQNIILGILWFICHNFQINWKTRKVKIIRCIDKAVEAKTRKIRVVKTKEKEAKEVEEKKVVKLEKETKKLVPELL